MMFVISIIHPLQLISGSYSKIATYYKMLMYDSDDCRLQSKRPSKPGLGPMPALAPDGGAVRMSASQYYRSRARYLPGIGKPPAAEPSKHFADTGKPSSHCTHPQPLTIRRAEHTSTHGETLNVVLCVVLVSDSKWEGRAERGQGERGRARPRGRHALRRAAGRGTASRSRRTRACRARTASDGLVRTLEARTRARLALLALVFGRSQCRISAQENHMCARVAGLEF